MLKRTVGRSQEDNMCPCRYFTWAQKNIVFFAIKYLAGRGFSSHLRLQEMKLLFCVLRLIFPPLKYKIQLYCMGIVPASFLSQHMLLGASIEFWHFSTVYPLLGLISRGSTTKWIHQHLFLQASFVPYRSTKYSVNQIRCVHVHLFGLIRNFSVDISSLALILFPESLPSLWHTKWN